MIKDGLHDRIIGLSMLPGMGSRKVFDVISKGAKCNTHSAEAQKEIEYIKKNGIETISLWDKEYPSCLKEIYAPPVLLYMKGQLKEVDTNSVAIVGSRRCTSYGYRTAEKLAFELALKGITVVSGLAKGIDEAAHRGALRAGGRTIAVMGSGFENLYPYGVEGLAGLIEKNGAVITEYSSKVKPLKYNFPQRNRIISGLSRGVVVVEASRKSGSLITADHALDQDREVFAVPGKIDSFLSWGTNELIKGGAKVVTSAEDIIEELRGPETIFCESPFRKAENGLNKLSGDHLAVLNMFEEGKSVHIDEMTEQLEIDKGALSRIVLEMEMNKRIKAMPGSRYMLVSN